MRIQVKIFCVGLIAAALVLAFMTKGHKAEIAVAKQAVQTNGQASVSATNNQMEKTLNSFGLTMANSMKIAVK